jgi:hypothetical protein
MLNQICGFFAIPPDLLAEQESSSKAASELVRGDFHQHTVVPTADHIGWKLNALWLWHQYRKLLEWEARHYAPDSELPWLNYPDERTKPLGLLSFGFRGRR